MTAPDRTYRLQNRTTGAIRIVVATSDHQAVGFVARDWECRVATGIDVARAAAVGITAEFATPGIADRHRALADLLTPQQPQSSGSTEAES